MSDDVDTDGIKTVHYLDMNAVGAWFDVNGTTVAKWRKRYAETLPCPAPDVMVGDRHPGWTAEREAEWRAWERRRPTRGVGGGRPRKER